MELMELKERAKMSTSQSDDLSLEEFKLMADRAGLGLSQQELEDLKPMFEGTLQHIRLLRSLDLQGEEMEVTFHPAWPAG